MERRTSRVLTCNATDACHFVFYVQVEAVDADAEDNGHVNYVIQHQQEGVRSGQAGKTGRNVRLGPLFNHTAKNGDPDVPFSIHPRSGHVIVTDTPLTMKSYSLFVEASDQPANPSERRHSLAVVQVIRRHPQKKNKLTVVHSFRH